jgi:membrane protease YdiL (CAAX protease family)
LWVIGLIIYNAFFGIYAHTLTFQFRLPSLKLAIPILIYSFATSLLEETLCRGLLLTAMVKAWGSTRRGLTAAAIFSGFVFASLHFFNLFIRPFPVVAMQVINMTIVGFLYAAIILSGRSIWPIVVHHWLVNASVNLQVSLYPVFEETTTGWAMYLLVMLPFVIIFSYLMKKVVLKDINENQNSSAYLCDPII